MNNPKRAIKLNSTENGGKKLQLAELQKKAMFDRNWMRSAKKKCINNIESRIQTENKFSGLKKILKRKKTL